MKRTAITLSLLTLCLGMFTQGDAPASDTHPNEVSVNVTPLLTWVFNLADGLSTTAGPFAISYKRVIGENLALRANLGIQYFSSVSDSQGQSSQTSTCAQLIEGSLGIAFLNTLSDQTHMTAERFSDPFVLVD